MGSVSDLLNSKHRNWLGSNNPPPVMHAPDPLQIYPLYSIIFCYQLVNRPFLGQRGYFMKSIYLKTISNPPPRILVHTICLVALPNEMNHSASFAIVRALRNGRGSFSALSHAKHRNSLGSNNTPPVMHAPTLLKSTPLFNNILLPIGNRPFLGQREGQFCENCENYFFRNYFQTPHTRAYCFSGGSTPTRWITLRRWPQLELSGMEWGRSQICIIQNIEIVRGAIIPPGHVCPDPLQIYPSFNNILLPIW